MMIGSKFTALLFITVVSTVATAFEPTATNLVASNPFELYLQPTFVELSLQAQAIAAQAVGAVLASAKSDLHDIDVVIQNVIHRPPQRRRLNANLSLPSTTITFAVLGTFADEMTGQRDYLNTLVQDTLTSNAGKAKLLQSLKSSHEHFKDLVNLQVSSTVSASSTTTESNDTQGFLESLSVVDIVLVAVSVCVLLGVTYMVIMSHRANRREHRRVLQALSNHEAAAANALRQLEQEENASISSRLQLLKSSMRRSSSMTIAPLDKPTTEEEAEATDDEDRESSGAKEEDEEEKEEEEKMQYIQSINKSVEQVPSIPSQKSSSSYHSAAELLASSQEIMTAKSMRSEGMLSDQDVIPSPQSSSDEDDDGNYSESASGYSSGISSARFSSSRWFQGNNANVPTPSEDTFDVFAIDVEKYDDGKLLLEDGSKTSATENFLEEWVKAIQVVPGEKSSAATVGSSSGTSSAGSASTPECASVQSGDGNETDKDTKEVESVTHQATPEKGETVAMDEAAPKVQV